MKALNKCWTCEKCGEVVYENFLHECKQNEANTESDEPVEVRCSEWVEELAQRWERRAGDIESGSDPVTEAEKRQAAHCYRTSAKELRAGAGSSSTVAICREEEGSK